MTVEFSNSDEIVSASKGVGAILFACNINAVRSAMAEAMVKVTCPGEIFVDSCGVSPGNPDGFAVAVLQEIGIDMAKQSPKTISNSMISNSFKTVNMGCMDKESCPALFVKDVIDWNIPDPKEKTIEQVREIRDQIKSEVLNLIKSIDDEK